MKNIREVEFECDGIDYYADVEIVTKKDPDYGADTDGNRGERCEFIEVNVLRISDAERDDPDENILQTLIEIAKQKAKEEMT